MASRMTIANESITFTPYVIWIQPLLSTRFQFGGDVSELLSILIAHPEIDITNVVFRVRNSNGN